MPSETRPSFRKPLSGPLGIFVFVGANVLTAYFAWTYSGFYRWFAELQIARTGQYEMKVTLLITFLVLIVPPTMLISLSRYIAERMLGTGPSDLDDRVRDYEPQTSGPSLAPSGVTDRGARQTHSKSFCALFGLPFLAVFAVVMWVIGGVFWYEYKTGDQMPYTTIEDWESGHAPTTQWVNLHGRTIPNAAVVFGRPGSEDIYVPVVSAKWRLGQPVQVFLKIYENEARKGKWSIEFDHQGMVGWEGLPGPVRARFEDRRLSPSEHYAVVEVGSSPENCRIGAIVLMSVGCLAVLAHCVGRLIHSARQRRDAFSSQPVG